MEKIKIEIKWGIIFVLVAIAWMSLEKLSGLHDTYIDKHPIYTNLFAIPAIAVYVLALSDKKKNYYGGQMTYKQGFISGLVITAVVFIINPLTQVIISKVITPDFFSNAIRYSVEHNLKTQQEAESYFNLKSYIIQGAIGTPIMGIVTSAIVAFFTRTRAGKN